MTAAQAMVLNQRFGVGFWIADDAIKFARHETARTGLEHDVTSHPIHGTSRAVYDVQPRHEKEMAA